MPSMYIVESSLSQISQKLASKHGVQLIGLAIVMHAAKTHELDELNWYYPKKRLRSAQSPVYSNSSIVRGSSFDSNPLSTEFLNPKLENPSLVRGSQKPKL